MSDRDKTLFVRHESGATHALRGARLARLLRELRAGRGMPEIMQLIDAGYTETLGGNPIDGEAWQALLAEADGRLPDEGVR